MKRIIPVLVASIIVNSLLFLMMNQMVSGKKHPPEKRAYFREIEFVRVQDAPKAGPKKKRATRRLPAFQKLAALKAPARPTKRPAPEMRSVQKIQSVSAPSPVPPKAESPKTLLQPMQKPSPKKIVAEPRLLDPSPLPVQLEKVLKSPPAPQQEIVSPKPEAVLPPESEEAEPEKEDAVEAFEFFRNRVAEVALDVQKEAVHAEAVSEASSDPISPTAAKLEVAVAEAAPPPQEASAAEAFETDVRPLFRMPPRYPRRAVRARLEGRVRVAFTITKNGAVQDPFVVESVPEKVFDQAALRAIRKWKFSPKQSSGKTVARRAIQNIRFTLKRSKQTQ